MKNLLAIPATIALLTMSAAAELPVRAATIAEAIGVHHGAFIFMDCASDEAIRFDSAGVTERLTPCSTFKIWNSLLGMECKIIAAADDPFYTWDGETRFIPEWNRDQTFRHAFQVSCVPAFQNLARKIGPVRMQQWLDSINYGDRDISSGIDIFWLPRPGKKSIRISPEEQAQLIRKLVTGKLPFSEHAQKILKEVMLAKTTKQGTMYGKTGSGSNLNDDPKQTIGWYVGYVESNHKTYAFACVMKGDNLTGKDTRSIVEVILTKSGLL
jgi:beta-lactamase class D